MEYYSFLYENKFYTTGFSFFPSPYGVSFILIRNVFTLLNSSDVDSFRLLTEYHSFLYNQMVYLWLVDNG